MQIAEKYETLEEDYVHTMLTTGKWKDDPVTANYNKCSCGCEMDPSWTFCPDCGKRRKAARNKKLANI